ncbi:MAG: hypothetical protein AVDCRST_MAG66-3385, partial [uncultured Pseudonocardia sp.]
CSCSTRTPRALLRCSWTRRTGRGKRRSAPGCWGPGSPHEG